jgi:putative phage-type endonuclease
MNFVWDEETIQWFFSESTMRAGTLPHHAKLNFKTFSKTCKEEEVARPPEFPAVEELTLRQYYYKHIHRTPEECEQEGEWEQRSEEWKNARKFALTASDFGAAAGTNPFESTETLLHKKLEETFQGNAATQWGSAMEPFAAEAFLQYAQRRWGIEGSNVKLHHPNLVKFSSSSWLAVSPDGVLEYMDASGKKHYDLVEFKCPTKAPTGKHPYDKYEGNIPPYYASQMLGIWGYCNSNGGLKIEGRPVKLERVWFVVWQPSDLWVSPFEVTMEAWRDLHVSLRKWYFEHFLPSLYRKMKTLQF